MESKSNRFRQGDLVGFIGDWSDFQMRDASHVRPMLEGNYPFDLLLVTHLFLSFLGIDPETALGICGLNGLTAYFGLLRVGELKEGEL